MKLRVEDSVIAELRDSCSVYFPDNSLFFNKAGLGSYVVSGVNLSKAINHIRNEQVEINVLNWFKDFWIYIELTFSLVELPKNKFPQISVSVSIFQGLQEDEKKTQLFRAEWDNYIDNTIHPQPHWHIYPVKYDSRIYEDFEAYTEMLSEVGTFAEELDSSKKNNIVDIRGFHFAMNSQWASDNGTAIHFIDSSAIVVNWMSGLLKNVREQLDYILE